MRGAGKGVEQFADAQRGRIDQMETLAILALAMGDVVDSVYHEIHRHDIDAPALNADHRQPRRQHTAQALDQLEEVIRAVDLVHFAAVRVADHQRRPVDAPGNAALAAHDPLGIVLGPEIRMLESLGLGEHVLAKQPGIEASGSDRTEQVKVLGTNRLGELQRITRAVDIDADLAGGIGLEVVDRGEMEEVRRPLAQLAALGRGNAEQRPGQVADDRHRATLIATPKLVELGQLFRVGVANQEKDGAARALEELSDQAPADEPGCPGDEILHCVMPRFVLSRP